MNVPAQTRIALGVFALLAGPAVFAQSWTALNNAPPGGLDMCLLLTDGGAMCQSDRNWYKLSPDLNGSYVNGTWTALATLPTGYDPNSFASAVLADGRVVIVGGEYTSSGQFVLSNSGAVYNPKTDSWTTLAPPAGWLYIGDAPSCLLPNGKLLIGSKLDQRMALLDPATLTWTAITPTGKFDNFNAEEGWTLLPDGSVLTLDVANSPASERFIPSLSSWYSAGNTPVGLRSSPSEGPITVAPGVVYVPPGEVGPLLRRPDGTVFAEGATGHTAIYTPPAAGSTAAGTWVQGPDFPSGFDAADAPAVLLPNGNVLAATSPGDSNSGLQFLEFNGTSLNSVPTIPNASVDSTSFTSMLLLPTGQAMLVDTSRSVQIYTPAGTYNPAWAPTITSVPTSLTNGNTYQISGTQFNGLSAGAAYGDEYENATNYPLVRITNIATGHVFYARTHDHSTMGIATGSATVSTSFDVPTNTELGAANLSVVANGIPSAPTQVNITGTVAPALHVGCPTANAIIGTAYSSAITANGGQPPYQFSIAGALPNGLTLNTASGAIQGNPTTAVTANFSAVVTDSFSPTPVSASTACSITVIPPPQVSYQGTDSTTQGSWKNVYGQDGWVIANDSTSLPAYASLAINGASTWTWLPSTSYAPALQKGNSATDRIASTYFAGTSFTFDLNLTGGSHQVALYLLDLDTTSRAESISVTDAVTNALLDQRSFANFHGGVYAIWNMQGHVLITVRLTGGLNPVVSGLFFHTQSTTTPPPPTVSLTAPAANANLAGTTTVTAQAQSSAGIANVQFKLDGANLGAAVAGTGPAFSTSWNTTAVANGPHTLAAVATDTLGQTTQSSPVVVTVNNVTTSPGSPTATFVSTDNTTRGNWKGTYGADGSIIANDSSNFPAYASITPGGALLYTWSSSTADPRALLKYASATDRIASTYFNYPSFTFDVNLTDGLTHHVALYCVDWDNGGRVQSISVVDPASGTTLDTRSIGNFQSGQYLIWNISGHVQFQIKQAAGPNAVVNGLFFDTPGGSGPPPAVTVSFVTPGAGQSVSATTTLSVNASAAAGIASVQYQLDGNNLSSAITAGPNYAYQWDTTTTGNGSHTLKAIATDKSGNQASVTVSVTVSNTVASSAAATFVKRDTTTQGSWKGVYGQGGEIIANDSNVLPSYAPTSAFSGAAPFTWTLTQDVKALQQANGTLRTACTFYGSPSFSFDLNITDGGAHTFAMYLLDWDGGGRAETIIIRDAATQNVLASETAASFTQGMYLVWSVRGHVSIQITATAGANAVVSGVFFGN